jgi:hypothetical protein
LKGNIMEVINVIRTINDALITEGAVAIATAEAVAAEARAGAALVRRATVQKVIDSARAQGIALKQFEQGIKTLFAEACEGTRLKLAALAVRKTRQEAGKKGAALDGTFYTSAEKEFMAAFVVPSGMGYLIPATAGNYRTSARMAFEGYPILLKDGTPKRDKQGRLVLCHEYRDSLFTRAELKRDYDAPASEGEGEETLPVVGKGLKKGKAEAKRPAATKTLTRFEVAGQGTALVHSLAAIGEADLAAEVRELLEDHGLWAVPKN